MLHNKQVAVVVNPQLRNLSLVCSLFQVAIQEMKACLGMFPVNHTDRCQGTAGEGGFRAIQVFSAENMFEGA